MRRVANILSIILLLFGMLVFAAPVYADVSVSSDLGLGITAGASEAGGQSLKGRLPQSLPEIIGQVLGVALAFLGVIFFILTLYSGFIWMFAHGKEDLTRKAKDTLVSAVIGLLIVLGSYSIVQFVFGAVDDTPAQTSGPGNQPVLQCQQANFVNCVSRCQFINCNDANVTCDGNYVGYENVDQACVLICAAENSCESLLDEPAQNRNEGQADARQGNAGQARPAVPQAGNANNQEEPAVNCQVAIQGCADRCLRDGCQGVGGQDLERLCPEGRPSEILITGCQSGCGQQIAQNIPSCR